MPSSRVHGLPLLGGPPACTKALKCRGPALVLLPGDKGSRSFEAFLSWIGAIVAKTKLSLDILMARDAPSYYVYNWYTAEVAKLGSDGATLSSGYEGHNYAVVSPAVGTDGAYAFVGEVDKYVTASKMRFPAGVQLAEESSRAAALTVQVAGVANETVKVCAIKTAGPSLECTSLHFDEAGTKPASFPPSSSP